MDSFLSRFPGSDHDEDRRSVRAVHQMMCVGSSGRDSREDALHRFADLFGFRPADIRDQFITGSVAQVAERVAEYVEAGAEKIAFISGGDWRATCASLGEIRALLA